MKAAGALTQINLRSHRDGTRGLNLVWLRADTVSINREESMAEGAVTPFTRRAAMQMTFDS